MNKLNTLRTGSEEESVPPPGKKRQAFLNNAERWPGYGRTSGMGCVLKTPGVFEQRNALARQRAHLRDEVRTKNAGSVFEQRNALARLQAHLRDEVRNRAGRACQGWRLLRLSDLTVFPAHARFRR
ncbi:hypothetical protein N1689_13130 [Pantoea sp. XY16]|uniref:hypothetical protein n=1 Tax=Pantoea sp. XY16 TaxID=2976705 RepID=UPI0021A8AE31|nr:hypothetical protein [Pantoea sp. XY16]MCT2418782.1 hypothetical protein [Pantoea sp. XY16]